MRLYQFWLGGILLPIVPDKVKINTGSQNKELVLVDGREINVLKGAKLRTVEFDALLPNTEYPFAQYRDGFQNADYFKNAIEELKSTNKVLSFVITRTMGLKVFEYTDISCTLENYYITESCENGFDVVMHIVLKEYRQYGAKFYDENNGVTKERAEDNAPQISGKTYTVQSGDSLWKIAKQYYGDGSRWTEIYNANSDKISNPNKISVGMVLTVN
jgi:nucleoid-associated protein YgaU